MIANCHFFAFVMSNCFLVKEGRSTLFTLAKPLKTPFFITYTNVQIYLKKENLAFWLSFTFFDWLVVS